ncbi:putative quinol monooxygenase [Gehongia tenuis]|uniref:Antibiotic biosynthesis monooxygenase n=1 Tax=Gehongia tenuis TaxID=2763655 RepID=A0A926D181_9FIRM|nr:putative quinol monooxygenase [Gehongia tenuis]MBC8530500.1 antibiotic biosynthesis monooxygenase [Gehongia tenuis]
MIIIVAKSVVKPGCKAAYIAAARELIEKSQAEPGCLTYDLYEDLNDPSTLTMIEFWKDQAAIDAHNASPHFTTIVPKLAEFREGPGEVHFYQKAE